MLILQGYDRKRTIRIFLNKTNELFDFIINNGVRLGIYHLSDELKSNKKIVLEILKNPLHYIDSSVIDLNHNLLRDNDFVLELTNINLILH